MTYTAARLTDLKKVFGEALRSERLRLGFRYQKDLATRVGTTPQNVGYWESGRSLPRRPLFDKLVEIFGDQSPITAVAPIIDATPEAEEPTSALLERRDDAPRFSRARPSLPTNVPAPDIDPSPDEDLRDYLPEELHDFVEVMLRAPDKDYFYCADYWSKTLGVEWKHVRNPTAHSFEYAAAKGTIQLAIIKAAAEAVQSVPRKLMLCIVVDGGLPQLGDYDRLLSRVSRETGALGIRLMACGSLKALAETIIKEEAGSRVTDKNWPEDESWGTW